MSERWRKPAVIFDAVEGDTVVLMPSGEPMVQANVSVDDETIARLKQGYLCMNCLEPQETPFPEACSLCGYTMRANQLRDLGEKPGNLDEVWVGSRIKPEDEIARMDEHYEYEQRTGIVLPDSVKFPTGPL